MTYARPTTIESPAVGNLYAARDGKRRAWQAVADLRRQVRESRIGGNGSRLRLELMRAESAHAEWLRMERESLSAIEVRANELGLTTIKSSRHDE